MSHCVRHRNAGHGFHILRVRDMTGHSADIEWQRDGVPGSRVFDDPYYSLEDGLAETRHVFLAGNDLAHRLAQELARPCLGQRAHHGDVAERRDGPDVRADLGDEFGRVDVLMDGGDRLEVSGVRNS